jgi:hypothetical protein
VAEAIVVPAFIFAKEIPEKAWRMLIRDMGFYNLKTIYVELAEERNAFVDRSWHPSVISIVFGFDSIAIPNGSDLAAAKRIDCIMKREQHLGRICPDTLSYWKEHGEEKLHPGVNVDEENGNMSWPKVRERMWVHRHTF